MTEFAKFIVKKTFFPAILIGFLIISSFFYELKPVSTVASSKIFEISPGDGFFEIAWRLKADKLIRSPFVFKTYSIFAGSAGKIKPGIYELSDISSTPEIIDILTRGALEAEVVIPDGASIYDVDSLLSGKKILPAGILVSFSEKNGIEGKLYPDTYRFFEHSTVESVINKFLDNFRAKAEPLLNRDPINYKKNLILASLVQKEVSDEKDSRIVAGILKKRLASGMKLDVDATICYLKKTLKGQANCYPLESDDFQIDSRYNTYLYAGLPPGPISNPNAAAISSVLNSLPSPYWFYLSDPKTGKTIFSKTLDEQSANRRIYFK